MKLKGGLKSALVALAAAVISFAVMSATAYIYLSVDTAKKSSVDASDDTVPYRQKKENRGVMFSFPDGTGCLFYLDFENMGITAVLTDSYDPYIGEYGGYGVDFTIEADFNLTAGLIDRAGGVELDTGEEALRFTGVQVTEMLSVGVGMERRRQIVSGVLYGFSQNGLTASDLVYIIENSKTDLAVPDCYGWHEELPQMCENINVFYIT